MTPASSTPVGRDFQEEIFLFFFSFCVTVLEMKVYVHSAHTEEYLLPLATSWEMLDHSKRDKETQQPQGLRGEAGPPRSTQYAPATVGASARTRTPEQCSVGDRRPESNPVATQDFVCLAGMLMSDYCTFSLGEDEMTPFQLKEFPPKTTKRQHL